jgi:hypothetical protein
MDILTLCERDKPRVVAGPVGASYYIDFMRVNSGVPKNKRGVQWKASIHVPKIGWGYGFNFRYLRKRKKEIIHACLNYGGIGLLLLLKNRRANPKEVFIGYLYYDGTHQ